MKNKVVSMERALSHIKDGMTVFIGGFLGVGTPEKIIDSLVEKKIKNLTIVGNDTGYPDRGIGKLVVNNQVKKVIVSHIGTNSETGKKMNANEIEVELVPQGTLAERIRAAGFGLGGILTATGLGTIVEEGKDIIEIDSKKYILEKPLKADIALLNGSIVDKSGNIVYAKATKNFNHLMATAADTVIVFAEKLVEIGEIDPDHVMTSKIFVDYIVTE
ncbi:CoA transferase subunit A [Fusobacterium sp. PH5-44]|uniref:CoA transferase subunit A n=1 Tax=unclassified Fusobacterium TaxID=2648384 RepID=UPI003D1FA6F1